MLKLGDSKPERSRYVVLEFLVAWICLGVGLPSDSLGIGFTVWRCPK